MPITNPVTFTYTGIHVTESPPTSLPPPPPWFSESNYTVLQTVLSNTDGLLTHFTLTITAPPPRHPPCKAIIKFFAARNTLMLGYAKRRCSAGKGMFLARVAATIGDVAVTVPCPSKFTTVLTAENKFAKVAPVDTGEVKIGGVVIKTNADVMTPCVSSQALVDKAAGLLEGIEGGKVVDYGTGETARTHQWPRTCKELAKV